MVAGPTKTVRVRSGSAGVIAVAAWLLGAVACGDGGMPSAMGGQGGFGGEPDGAGGVGGSGPNDVRLEFDGMTLSLPGSNSCVVNAMGTEASFQALTPAGAVDDVAITLGSNEEDFAVLVTGGMLRDVPLGLFGTLDLEGFEEGVQWVIQRGPLCSADLLFVEAVDVDGGETQSLYEVSFNCSSIPYQRIDIATSNVVGGGLLSEISGQFRCLLNVIGPAAN